MKIELLKMEYLMTRYVNINYKLNYLMKTLTNAIVGIVDCKRCFKCKRNYPLFLFHVNNSKYQREADKGVTVECRICCYKRMKKDKGIMQRIDNKFTFVNINPIKYMLKK